MGQKLDRDLEKRKIKGIIIGIVVVAIVVGFFTWLTIWTIRTNPEDVESPIMKNSLIESQESTNRLTNELGL